MKRIPGWTTNPHAPPPLHLLDDVMGEPAVPRVKDRAARGTMEQEHGCAGAVVGLQDAHSPAAWNLRFKLKIISDGNSTKS